MCIYQQIKITAIAAFERGRATEVGAAKARLVALLCDPCRQLTFLGNLLSRQKKGGGNLSAISHMQSNQGGY